MAISASSALFPALAATMPDFHRSDADLGDQAAPSLQGSLVAPCVMHCTSTVDGRPALSATDFTTVNVLVAVGKPWPFELGSVASGPARSARGATTTMATMAAGDRGHLSSSFASLRRAQKDADDRSHDTANGCHGDTAKTGP